MSYSKTDLAVTKYVAGGSLIEVLVALIIFSVGVLGIVGIQLSATHNSQINNHFIQAKFITNNLANRIKLNKASLLTSQRSTTQHLVSSSKYFTALSYDLSVYGNCQDSYYQCFCLQVVEQIPTCRVTSCNSEQLTQFDTYDIACMLALISNDAAIHIYPTVINADTLLLSINLIWPAQSLSKNNVYNNSANKTEFSFIAANSDCDQAIQGVSASSKSFMCFSQSLVITATYYDS
jgi:type IV pilus modification protein PilV